MRRPGTLATPMTRLAAVLLLGLAATATAQASSHLEAPATTVDPYADNTDVYAFHSPGDPNSITLIANYIPIEEPAGGPNYFGFSDNTLYEIHVDNDGDCNEDITYRFTFQKNNLADPTTYFRFLGPVGAGLPDRNVQLIYTATRITSGGTTTLVSGAATSPYNVGPRSNSSIFLAMLNSVQTNGSTKIFAGVVDDPFFMDLAAFYDLLTIRVPPGLSGGGVDSHAGRNVASIAIEVPITDLTRDGEPPDDETDPDAILGVWATASRRSIRLLQPGGKRADTGDWVQVSRLGMPLVGQVLVPLGDRDEYNRRHPSADAGASQNFLLFSDVPSLLGAALGIEPPPPPRLDMVSNFQHVGKTPAGCNGDVLRLNVKMPSGFPNGRQLEDDVVDIALHAVMYGTIPPPDSISIGDGVDENDRPFLTAFPYMGAPHRGFDHAHHP